MSESIDNLRIIHNQGIREGIRFATRLFLELNFSKILLNDDLTYLIQSTENYIIAQWIKS